MISYLSLDTACITTMPIAYASVHSGQSLLCYGISCLLDFSSAASEESTPMVDASETAVQSIEIQAKG